MRTPCKSLLAFAAALLVGCGINPQYVAPIASSTNYFSHTCEQLSGEKARIEQTFAELRYAHRHGTYRRLGELKGEAINVDAAAQQKGCSLQPVRIPRAPTQQARDLRQSS